MAEAALGRARRRVAGLAFAAIVALAVATAVGAPAAHARGFGPADVVRFEPADDTHLRLLDRGRYAGALELRAGSPGIVVNELAIERYVAGVDEMPSRWHPEALRAQAIAARTYAWYSIEQDAFDGYDVCASTACQVYRGIGAVDDEDTGGRWLDAVEDTAGQVLLHEGRPILARYFSTSGGRTVGNEVAFPSSGSRPYLVGIDDPYDEASPYHRWTARFSREEFDTLLARGETLAAAVPVAEVERIGAVDDPGATIRVTGEDGYEVEVGARDFSDFVSRMAADSFPDRFPGVRADGFRPLPSTVPSSRFAPEVTEDEVVLHGRGWGHAVGMGQYGANARAQDGQDHRDILAAYYGGSSPTTTPELPATIRVGLEATGPHRIVGTGAMRIVVDGEVAVERTLGSWTATHDASGWHLAAPDGHDAELDVAATRLAGSASSAPGTVTVATDVNKPVLLRLEVTDDAGTPVATRRFGAVNAGEHVATWRMRDDEGDRLPDGEYRVALMAEDADGAVAGEPVLVSVGDDDPEPGGGGAASATGPPLFVVGAGVALLLALAILAITIRRRTS